MIEHLDSSSLEMFHAAASGNIHAIQEVLTKAAFPLIDAKDLDGFTMLMYAVQNGQKEVIQFLINNEACPSSKSKTGKTIFHLAAEHGDATLIEFLVESLRNRAASQMHLSHIQCSRQRKDNQKIIENQIQDLLNIAEDEKGFTALHTAVYMIQISCVKSLIHFGCNINQEDFYKRTPLCVAMEKRQSPHLVVYLVEKGAKMICELELEPLKQSILSPSTMQSTLNNSTFLGASMSDLKRQFNDQHYSDVTFVVGNMKLYAKKEVLVAKSLKFAQIFQQQDLDPNDIRITDISFRTFYQLLEWIYKAELKSNNLSDLLEIWIAASQYGVKDLHRMAQLRLVDILQAHKSNLDVTEGKTNLTFLKYIKDLFEEAQVRKSRYLNRFCATYLMENIDTFLTDIKCFDGTALNTNTSALTNAQYLENQGSSSRLTQYIRDTLSQTFSLNTQNAKTPSTLHKELYVQWLFLAANDVFIESYIDIFASHQKNAEMGPKSSLKQDARMIIPTTVTPSHPSTLLSNLPQTITQYTPYIYNNSLIDALHTYANSVASAVNSIVQGPALSNVRQTVSSYCQTYLPSNINSLVEVVINPGRHSDQTANQSSMVTSRSTILKSQDDDSSLYDVPEPCDEEFCEIEKDLPSNNPALPGAKQFEVSRTNWFWRQNYRVLEVTETSLNRIDPVTGQLKSSVKLSDIDRIDVEENNTMLVITYRENVGLQPDRYQCGDVSNILRVIMHNQPDLPVQLH